MSAELFLLCCTYFYLLFCFANFHLFYLIYFSSAMNYFLFSGRFLCEWRRDIHSRIKNSGLNLRPGIESYIPLWQRIDQEGELRMPPVVVVNNKNIIQEYYAGGDILD